MSSSVGYGLSIPLVAIAAGALGATFPLICHYGVAPDARAGSGLSYLYLANILGATAGSLFTGFILMDVLTTGQINAVLALAGLALSGGLALAARQKAVPLIATAISALGVILLSGPLFHGFYERLQYKDEFAKNDLFAEVVENRHGVITVSPSGAVYGGGMYDGVFNVDLMHDRNMIVRAFSLSAFHPNPKRVLMIGLASGSWAQVLAHHPQLEHMTIVEINPGYTELVAKYPEVSSLLTNPKIEIIIDDGRRWLNSNPDVRFDAVVMNTTWHWRAHSSSLLSLEFLQILRNHLNPGGMALYNTTDSDEVQRTACAAFPHVVRVINNVVVSDTPLMPDKERWRRVLVEYRINDKPVVDLTRQDHRDYLEHVLGMVDTITSPRFEWWGMEVRSSILRRTEGVPIVTDDNMGTEWLLRQRTPKRD
jgi:spermidine synthase